MLGHNKTRQFCLLVALSCSVSRAFVLSSLPHHSSLATTTSRISASNNNNEIVPLQPGSSVALVTPFLPDKPDMSVDEESLVRLLNYHVDAGTKNLCLLGTTGEASVLTMKEREQILNIAVDTVKGKLPILVGTGTINPASVKEQTMQAMDCGADAALVVTPYYVKPPQRCLIQHFTDLGYLDFPIVVYNVPGRTGVNMDDSSIAIAALHENIVGVKDATGDVSRVASLKQQLQQNGVEDFLLYSGDDATTVDFLLEGGDGSISVTANVAAKILSEIVESARSGDAEVANLLNSNLTNLHSDLFCESNPIPVKYALKRLGLIQTHECRPPLDRLLPELEPKIDAALRAASLL